MVYRRQSPVSSGVRFNRSLVSSCGPLDANSHTGVRPPEIIVLVRTNRVGAVRSAGRKSRLPCLAVGTSQNARLGPLVRRHRVAGHSQNHLFPFGIHCQSAGAANGSSVRVVLRSQRFIISTRFYAVSRTFGDRPLNESRAVAISSGFFRGLGMPRKMLPKIGCFEILIRITLAMAHC